MTFKEWYSSIPYGGRENITEKAWETATLAERERCAKVCEGLALAHSGIATVACCQCGEAIRSVE